jgi:hypothetical protein
MNTINPARRMLVIASIIALFFAVVTMACGGPDLVCPTGPGSCYNPDLGQPKGGSPVTLPELPDQVQDAANQVADVAQDAANAAQVCSGGQNAVDLTTDCADAVNNISSK